MLNVSKLVHVCYSVMHAIGSSSVTQTTGVFLVHHKQSLVVQP